MGSVSDNFNRADENPIASPWVAVEGTIYLGVAFADNEVTGGGFGIRNCVRYGGAGLGANQEAQVRVKTASISTNELFLGPCVRCASGAVSYYAFHSDNAQSKIIKVVAGTPTTLVGGGAPTVATDVMRLRVVGTTLTAYINGVQELTITDASLASGDPGFLIDGSNTPALNNFFAQDVSVVPLHMLGWAISGGSSVVVWRPGDPPLDPSHPLYPGNFG
jgi:hypothetical protein